MKRTKRYGGFRIGDRVYPKNKKDWRLDEGKVIHFQNGYVIAQFFDCGFTNPVLPFMPNQLINLTRQQEERTNGGIGTIPPKTKLVVLEDLPATPFKTKVIGNIQEARLKLGKLQDIKLKAERDLVIEALRQTELILSPLQPYGDSIPEPYKREMYSTTKDY